ncbi:MAG: PA14 domain-containing protein [Verrucomicrobiota bacterium]
MVTLSHGPASEAYTADRFASRYRAYLTPTVTGHYRFWIAGDDQVELWLSTVGPKYYKQLIACVKPKPWEDFNKGVWTGREQWDLRGSQQSDIFDLKAGSEYFIEVLHKDGGGDDHMSVAWQYRPNNSDIWSRRALVPTSNIRSYDGDDDDNDDDYLPNSWEKRYNLDPNDNGIKDPARQGEDGDFDHDGISNRDEFMLGTNPASADTDGDGASDYDEVFNLGTNPLVRDSINDYRLATIPIGDYNSASSLWHMTSGGLISESFRGSISWPFTVPSDGFWLFQLKTELMGVTYGSEYVPVIASIDGSPVISQRLGYPASNPFATLQALTPFLAAGGHTLTITIDNMVARRSLRLVSLDLFTPPNAELLLARTNRILPHPEFTRTSPACVEGHARMLENASVNGAPVLRGVGGASATYSLSFSAAGKTVITAGDGEHWYCNVPLENQDNSQSYTVVFEQGFSQNDSLTWQATNVLDCETLVIRQGDSLRLGAWTGSDPATAQGAATAALISSSGASWNLVGRQTVAASFPDAGTFTIRATRADTGVAAVLTIRVIPPPDFSGEPLDALGEASRTVTWKADDCVSFDANHEICVLFVDRPAAGSADVTLFAHQPGASGVAARLGPEGPILAIQPLNVVGVSDALENDFTSQGTSPIPGYKLYVSPLTVTHLPDKGRVDVAIIRAGVMFPNGSTNRTVIPIDLTNDCIDLEFLFPVGMPGAYCHILSVFGRKGDYLGTR